MARVKYTSDIARSVHTGAARLFKLGHLDASTMRELDELCLTSVEPFAPEDVLALRIREKVSQGVLARHLSVSVSTVSQWERGERRPSGPSLKLLTLAKTKGLDYIS